MKINKNGSVFEFVLDGAIGETSDLFSYDVRGATRIDIDMMTTTYINSAGVKAWIQWTVRIPQTARVVLKNLPLVMVNQVNTVQGFATPRTEIESFQAPFVCSSCNTESLIGLCLGREYDYRAGGSPKRLDLPRPSCPKCKEEMEADFSEAKTFSFLDKPLVKS